MSIIKKLALVVVSLSLVAVSSVSSAKPFSPKKPVELIIPAGQGGGADEIARLVQGVIEKNDYASKPETTRKSSRPLLSSLLLPSSSLMSSSSLPFLMKL